MIFGSKINHMGQVGQEGSNAQEIPPDLWFNQGKKDI